MLLVLQSMKLVLEIALMALIGQGLLALIAGERRSGNLFYQLLQIVTRPFTGLARWITPRQVADRHVGFVAFFLLSIGWVVVFVELVRYCVAAQMVGCR